MANLTALWAALGGAAVTGIGGYLGPLRLQKQQSKSKLAELQAAAAEKAEYERKAALGEGVARLTLLRSASGDWYYYLERIYQNRIAGVAVSLDDFDARTDALEQAARMAARDLTRVGIWMGSSDGPAYPLSIATTAMRSALTTPDQVSLAEVREDLDQAREVRSRLMEAVKSSVEENMGRPLNQI